MSFPFFIARRYLIAKKSSTVISAISWISMAGVAVACAALVVVLSVFNGFQDMVASYFTSFDPQLKIIPAAGKTIATGDSLLLKIRQLPFVESAHEIYEERALAIYGDRQEMVIVKGVDSTYMEQGRIQSILIGERAFFPSAPNAPSTGFAATPGILVAQKMNLGLAYEGFLKLYAPVRSGQLDLQNLTSGFVVDSLPSSGQVFQVTQPKYDAQYILAPIAFVRNLYAAQGQLTSLELKLRPGENLLSAKQQIRTIAQNHLLVQDRYEQQSDTFRVMNIEKLLAYIFLTFILLVSCFNIIGTLSMLIIDKQKNLATFRALGATRKQIVQIFLFEGRLIAAIGAVIGIAVGLLLCWLQEHFGLVRLGDSDGTFIVDAYPVSIHATDILWIAVTVLLVSWITIIFPVRQLVKQEDLAR